MNSSIRRWALLAIVTNLLFFVSWNAANTWQGPHYSNTAHTISDMYADGAPGAWFLIVVFTGCGAVAIMFALRSVWPALREAGPPARIASILLAVSIFGLGDLLSAFEREGCRLADPGCTPTHQLSTTGGTMDAVLSNFGVLALAVSGFFLAAAMRRLPAWAGKAKIALIVTIVFVLIGVADAAVGASLHLGGFFERLVAVTGVVGLIMLAAGIRRRTPKPAADPVSANRSA